MKFDPRTDNYRNKKKEISLESKFLFVQLKDVATSLRERRAALRSEGHGMNAAAGRRGGGAMALELLRLMLFLQCALRRPGGPAHPPARSHGQGGGQRRELARPRHSGDGAALQLARRLRTSFARSHAAQVAPEYRRQGLAQKLMSILEEITIKRRGPCVQLAGFLCRT